MEKEICLLCLESIETEQIGIFSKEGMSSNIYNVILKHIGVEILKLYSKENSNVLKYICKECSDIVLSFNEFYQKIEFAHQQFQMNYEKLDSNDMESIVCTVSEEELNEEDSCTQVTEIEEIVFLSEDAITIDYEDKDDLNIASECVKENQDAYINSDSEYNNFSPENITLEHIQQESQYTKNEITLIYDHVIAKFKELVCGYCQTSVVNFRELTHHCGEAHKKSALVVCCNFKLNKRNAVYDHIVKHHTNPNYFKCEKCDKRLSNRYSFKSHMSSHEDVQIQKSRCKICSKIVLQDGLSNHMLTHLPEKYRKFKCTSCNKGYASKQLLQNHIKYVHLRKRNIVCEKCGKSFSNRQAFDRHQMEHDGIKLPPVECKLCGGFFKYKYLLNDHMKLKHSEQTPRACKICEHIAPNLKALRQHTFQRHDLRPKHKCHRCSKIFILQANLNEHIFLKHSGDYELYACLYCPKKFQMKCDLNDHESKMHPIESEERKNIDYSDEDDELEEEFLSSDLYE